MSHREFISVYEIPTTPLNICKFYIIDFYYTFLLIPLLNNQQSGLDNFGISCIISFYCYRYFYTILTFTSI